MILSSLISPKCSLLTRHIEYDNTVATAAMLAPLTPRSQSQHNGLLHRSAAGVKAKQNRVVACRQPELAVDRLQVIYYGRVYAVR